ncbi:transmembrane amino acid transporter protein-domain-containing protein [Dactylonectria estremocensis]|uniref:Transmembrane amino acid transporter protein-domain-containing protein n=1 Tax=Dactylonectria estremocensis TaxID=1079267 RepID=A0A9P9EN80_9HYPO|nr:transmembrane amino acid transporter protein-domain-containing protein [Dactylonectria estremocensis]
MNHKNVQDDLNGITHIPSGTGEVIDDKALQHDAVFGELTEGGPNYRNVGWLGTTAIMMKAQIGLGVLSMPAVFDTFGIVPGVIVLLTIAGITTWSDWMVGIFKLRHREVYGIDDVGRMLFGRIGYEVFGAMYCLFFTFVAGSALLGVSIALNAISEHGTCTAGFVASAAILSFMFASIRTLGQISWLAWIGATCIIISVSVVTVAVGLQDRPSALPANIVEWKSDFKIINNPTFAEAISAISTLIFSYAGTPAFFNIVAEMRDPHQYTRALATCQTTITVIYIIVGIVVYYFCGSYVASPALGSAGPLIKKVSYGIALPGLLASAMIMLHLPAKHIFVRILRGTEHLSANSVIHWVTWLGSTFSVSLVAYLIASGIPVFGGLVSLIGALLGTFLCFQPMGCMWLYDSWGDKRTIRWHLMVAWSVFVIVLGTFLMIAGTYGSITSLLDSYKAEGGTKAWSCADNSNST